MKDLGFFHRFSVGAAISLTLLAFTANSQPAPSRSSEHMGMGKSGNADSTPSTKAFMAADEEMMKHMDAPYSGDPDQDFVSHMIAHHQGAIDMAEVELKYGKDPELRKSAAEIIQAQDKEIALMKQWQSKHPTK
jgi:uncharacterized protein (DUF305 family)